MLLNIHPITSLAISLFLLMDPIGNVPLYVSILGKLPVKRQRAIIVRELIIALAVIFIFYFAGDLFLQLLRISQETVKLSGGIILFLIAVRMIFPPQKDPRYSDNDFEKDPFIVPLAIPLIAGPSILAAVMIYSRQEIPDSYCVAAILIAWIASFIILILSPLLTRLLGKRGLGALEKLMGLILTLIAIQMLLEGLSGFIEFRGQFLTH